MKIKCPYCKKEYNVKTWLDIANHDEEVCNVVEILPNKADYYSLLFKIHEKIELVEKLQETRQKEFNEIDFTNDQIIKELKSLLEDKN